MTEFLQALILGLLIGGVYALLASGLTLIFGVMNVINIAHGAFLILAAFITWSIWRATGLDPLAAIVVVTPVMFALGWLLYNATIRPIRQGAAAASVLLTFGLALFLEGIMGVIWGNTSHSVRPATPTSASRSASCSCRRRRCSADSSRSSCSPRSIWCSRAAGWGARSARAP